MHTHNTARTMYIKMPSDFYRYPEPAALGIVGEPGRRRRRETNNRSSLHQYSSSYKFHTPSSFRASLNIYTLTFFLFFFSFFFCLAGNISFLFLSLCAFDSLTSSSLRFYVEEVFFFPRIGGREVLCFVIDHFWSIISWSIVSTRLDRFFFLDFLTHVWVFPFCG